MDKFDRYFKGANKSSYDRLVNTYVDYSTNYSKHYLLTNGYSIVLTDIIRTDFIENKIISESIKKHFNGFIDKTNISSIESFDYNYIKNNGVVDNKDHVFKIANDYCINIPLLNKIKGLIGCNKINVILKNNSDMPIIEVVGKYMQVGYLLPMRVY